MTGNESGGKRNLALHYLILTAPTLLLLATLHLAFGPEQAITAFFETHNSNNRALDIIFEQLSRYGNIPYYVIYALILFIGIRRDKPSNRYFVVSYLIALFATLAAVETLKAVVGKPRPGIDAPPFPFSGEDDYESFPSSHMTETAMTTTFLALRYRHVGFSLFAGLSTALMGFARIYLGEHHPSDILLSLLLGCVFAIGLRRLLQAGRTNRFLNLTFLFKRSAPPSP